MPKKSNGSVPHVRVFVGASPRGMDAEACLVCEASLRRRSSAPVDVEWLVASDAPADPCGGWNRERWSTPWTPLRWAVPALCGWEGRAIYFDCPTLVLGDAAELAQAEFPEGACVLARRSGAAVLTGCLVFDCAAARNQLPDLDALRADVGAHQTVAHLLTSRPALLGDLPPGWGLRDADFSRDPAAATGSVHFSSPALQPHQERARARMRGTGVQHWYGGSRLPHYSEGLVALYEAEYQAALGAGYEVAQYVPAEGAPVARTSVERRERA